MEGWGLWAGTGVGPLLGCHDVSESLVRRTAGEKQRVDSIILALMIFCLDSIDINTIGLCDVM